ncbi:hypothetical protein [Nocardia cyriacigeorgica]|uniref:hypothetical protein n=1 Tax=Nocardia cyriacigeorgica TaxID=135487 RepID=UPI0024552928|nr:hypothetical protein [Nocardia cyriacigeorgica]BDU06675.1 hypothetical protein FMUBM48_29380 [Nocardia cyriacigeorgica]
MAAKVTRLRIPPTCTLRSAAEAFLDTIGPANTRRAYGIAIVKTVDQLDGRDPDAVPGHSRALDSVSDDEIGAALETLWGQAAVNTWNARRAAVAKWLSWCREQGWNAPRSPDVGRAVHPAGLRDTGALADRDRPAHLPPRGPPAGEDTVADAV